MIRKMLFIVSCMCFLPTAGASDQQLEGSVVGAWYGITNYGLDCSSDFPNEAQRSFSLLPEPSGTFSLRYHPDSISYINYPNHMFVYDKVCSYAPSLEQGSLGQMRCQFGGQVLPNKTKSPPSTRTVASTRITIDLEGVSWAPAWDERTGSRVEYTWPSQRLMVDGMESTYSCTTSF
ncbi:MAG: hypothetical protein AB7G93_04260 [Bdellovibrionales bacterium]